MGTLRGLSKREFAWGGAQKQATQYGWKIVMCRDDEYSNDWNSENWKPVHYSRDGGTLVTKGVSEIVKTFWDSENNIVEMFTLRRYGRGRPFSNFLTGPELLKINVCGSQHLLTSFFWCQFPQSRTASCGECPNLHQSASWRGPPFRERPNLHLWASCIATGAKNVMSVGVEGAPAAPQQL